jgi:flagellar export protein FliJ
MKAKKYRLETVLGIRNRAREEAARQVALRLQQLQAAEEELARRRKKLQTCYEQQNNAQKAMHEELSRGIQARGILAHQNYLNDLRNLETQLQADVEKQIHAVTKAEKELAATREKLIEAARDLKSIEAHKENWQTAVQKEASKRDQKISDEIGAILHGRRESS